MALMWLMFLCFPIILIDASKYHQIDYDIKESIVELVNYNRSYIRDAKCGLVYYNRTFRALNASAHVIKDFSRNLKAEIQVYKLYGNEYKFFPITLSIDGCREVERDTFGLKESWQKSLNFEFRCPFKQGFYRMLYGKLDFSHFPPYLPTGQYKCVGVLLDNKNFVLEVHIYAKVKEKIKKWEY